MESENLSQNFQPNQVPEQNYQNDINTEENVIYTPPSMNVPVDNKVNYVASNAIYNSNPNPNTNANTNSNTDTNSLWYDLSILSWFLFLCTGWNLFKESSAITFGSFYGDTYKPLCTNLSLTIAITSTISTIGFILYFRGTTLVKNQSILNGMLGDMSKFHFIPLLLVTILFMSLTNAGTKGAYIFGLIFSLLSYVSLFFIYLKTEFSGEWYEIITIKKGAFSCLIAITWYTFFSSFAAIGMFANNPSDSFKKGTGIAFSILVGLGNLGFSFFFKDVLVGVINLVLYIEMAKYFYINKEGNDVTADGIIQIIMAILSMGLIFYLYFKERESLYRP